MDFFNYEWRALCLASLSVIAYLRKTAIFIQMPLFIIGAILFWRIRGLSALREEVAIFFAFTLAPNAGMAFLVFLWNLILAPSRMERRMRDKICALSATVQDLENQLRPPLDDFYSLHFCEAQYPEEHHDQCTDQLNKQTLVPFSNLYLYIRIRPKRPTKLSECNIRFLPNETDNQVPQNILHITDIRESVSSRLSTFNKEIDNKGGFAVRYEPPITLKDGESLWFTLIVDIRGEWQGLLSFRWYDEDHIRHQIRRHVEFSKLPKQSRKTGVLS